MGVRRRARQLTTKFAAHPVLPALGWTKTVESAVAGGPILNWIAYAAVVTLVWVAFEDVQRRADDLADGLAEVTE